MVSNPPLWPEDQSDCKPSSKSPHPPSCSIEFYRIPRTVLDSFRWLVTLVAATLKRHYARGRSPPAPSTDDDILLAAYASYTENQDAIDASALQLRPPAPQSRAPFPLATAPPTGTSLQSHTSPTISAAATGTRKAPSATSPLSPTLATSSKLPRFLHRPPAELRHPLRRTPLAPPPPLTPASASGRCSATASSVAGQGRSHPRSQARGAALTIDQSGHQTTASPTS
ncbi:hypothetical protein DFH08DRAFT_953638 [Mycena albidolilacea]|uniref:Uncharacterized protein n=1 Tax=Mycena albidolilacea TaxID=1033008 RepID=A0AAD7AHB4_9AGAR|nr:hypothetical protein DFH08DRAFT_953638 [Mycena albidolilacea]